jgi:hypothetical protein
VSPRFYRPFDTHLRGVAKVTHLPPGQIRRRQDGTALLRSAGTPYGPIWRMAETPEARQEAAS